MRSGEFFSSLNSWSDFCVAAAAQDEGQRGFAFELVVRHYLASEPIYRAKLAQVWLRADVPADVQARLKLPPCDMGIDLVAQTHAGEFWAIQAKYRSAPDASLTFAELSTFASLAFTVCRGFSFALVCTTTARIPEILSGLPQIGDLTNEIWAKLDGEFFASLRASLTTATPPALPPARVPKPHQERAIASAVAHFRDRAKSRGRFISPCGSGKSLTACWIAQALGARRVLIAVPSLALIRQTLETWMRETLARGEPADWLCVCSDEQVADFEDDMLLAHVHELGIPSTRPDELVANLAAARDRAGLLVVLTTYQSSPVLAATARTAGIAFDLAVLDEAHKTTGRSAGSFAHLLFDENLAIPRRLFMTATERRFQGSTDDIVSMDDGAIYGDTFEKLTFKAAIAAVPPILSDYRILTIGVRESEVARLVETNRWLDLGAEGLDEVAAQALASVVALRRATAAHGVRHTVSFHNSIARARQFRDFCARLNGALDSGPAVEAFHVSGRMGSGTRAHEIARFLAATPSLVTNARCLAEGVDIPEIDCVFFADPKGSTIEIVQAAGRALRLDPKSGKTMGYILLPLVVRDGATLDDVAASSAFKFVLFVLRALATNDDRIVEWFRATAEGRTPEVGGLVQFDFGQVVTPLGVDAAEFANRIEVKCWESVAKLSYVTYEVAKGWAKKLGIRSQREWREAFDRLSSTGEWPCNIPKSVSGVYASNGWIDWGEFLGTGRKAVRRTKAGIRRKPIPFEAARAWARSLGIKSSEEWQKKYCLGLMPAKEPMRADVPNWPDRSYRNQGWISWTDFLGCDWAPFERAREFARSLNFSGQRQWKQFCKGERPELPPKPDDIPAAPWYAYANRGWSGWRDWLGTTKPPREKSRTVNGSPTPRTRCRAAPPSRFREFEPAREFARALKLKSSTEWYAFVQGRLREKGVKPADIPSSPHGTYAEHWQGWGDWLGTGNVAPFRKIFRPFGEARVFAPTLGLRTGEDWNVWCRTPGSRPTDVPSSPEIVYREQGWISWPDFLQPPSANDSAKRPARPNE